MTLMEELQSIVRGRLNGDFERWESEQDEWWEEMADAAKAM